VYPVTEAFARHLTGDHEVTTRIQALPSPEADPVDISQYFEGGSLTVAPQAIRRSGTITLVDSDSSLLPLTADSLIAPYGQELIVEHGLVFPDGTEELVPQGVFRITDVSVRYPTITLTLSDRAWVVSGARLEAPLTIAKGTPYTEAIRLLLVTAYPQIVIETVVSEDITPTIVLEDQADPWDEAKKMVEAIGFELDFDRLGVCQLGPTPDLAAAEAVWTYSDASDQFIPREDRHWFNLATFDQDISWDTDDAHNAVIATGENTDNDTPFRGVAKDLDPSSPTFYGGRFGKRPMFWSSPLITSNQMAERSASTMLQKELGIAEALRFEAIAHPALDIGDPVQVVRGELGINHVHVVDGLSMPLRAGTQTVETRRRRVVLGV
jgi:hypothetical protein